MQIVVQAQHCQWALFVPPVVVVPVRSRDSPVVVGSTIYDIRHLQYPLSTSCWWHTGGRHHPNQTSTVAVSSTRRARPEYLYVHWQYLMLVALTLSCSGY